MVTGEKRTRILLSAYACEPNKGSEPGVGWNWAIHLAEHYEVYVITRANNKNPIEKYLKEHSVEHLIFYYHDCSKMMKKVKKLPNGIFLYYKKWQSEILPIAKKIISEENIDIVHHITFNEFRTPGKLYKLEKPFVWGPIGGGQFYNPVFKKAYFHKSNLMKERFRNLINKCYLLFSTDIKNAVKYATAILIADQSTEKIMPQNRKYIRLLETAYNLDRNSIKDYSEEDIDYIKLLWVGGIWPRKGLKVLIDALGESNFRKFELEIIGNGEDWNDCEKLVKKYNIQDYVHFAGALSYQDVNNHYDKADIFIFTSIRDTSGNVVLEAMSHGLPVITLNHHGAGEMVTNETGTLVDVTSYQKIKVDIVDAIKNYAADRNRIRQQGVEARKRVEKVYSWEYNIAVMMKVYDSILEG
ncbi:glycosyltransferase family 4 protein [Clostridium sp. 001]|uniref:glycosyltransferase family 4 protein n=1 Tax=Clostridium sp. 001 TaxID=1970093 RepID=UPI001C2BC128|nr:glycosyltransferase family 4 protein [Clostridium sp. 001]QXE19770.1 hypothetical protein B5S50_13570 [Clostridium sp. 001]